MSTFKDRYAEDLVYDATAPVYEEKISCACGHKAYPEDAIQYDGEWYCSNECKNKAVFEDSTPGDHKEFALGEWASFLEYLQVNEKEFIKGNLDNEKPAREMWAAIFKEYAKDDLYAFADWYETREPIPYRRTA